MKINGEITIRRITSCCPECGKESGTDLGSIPLNDKMTIEKDVSFWCDNHGQWFQNLEISLNLSQPYPTETDEDDDIDIEGEIEEMGLEECEQCGEIAWDGSICHACGAKEI